MEKKIARLGTRRNLAIAGTGLLIVVVAAVFLLYQNVNKPGAAGGVSSGSGSLQASFAYLSQQHTNVCQYSEASAQGFMQSQQDNTYLQGSCCFQMSYSSYSTQVSELKNFAGNPLIPQNPYNVSTNLAKQLWGYYQNITLTPAQQQVFNQAVNISKDTGGSGAPCCCTCWRYYAFYGQAKYFIAHDTYNATQLAYLWSAEKGCGGPDTSTLAL